MPVFKVSGFKNVVICMIEARTPYDAKKFVQEDFEKRSIEVDAPIDEWKVTKILDSVAYSAESGPVTPESIV